MKRRNRNKKNWYKNKDIGIAILLGVIVVQIIALVFLFKKPAGEKKVKVLPKAKIAIVLDDWGYNIRNIKYLKIIDSPVTIAVLPDLVYSRKVADEAKRNKKEVIVHLPLEPHPYESMGLELNTIKTNMGEKKIIRLLNQSLRSVPHIKGISSHMGSKATEDLKTMEVIFKELKKRRLYFLDSFVTTKSICKELSKRMRINFSQRDIFLDNNQDPNYIRNQLAELVEIAERKGYAIGIGHDRKNTLEVLAEEIPKLEEQGFMFVFLSDLAN